MVMCGRLTGEAGRLREGELLTELGKLSKVEAIPESAREFVAVDSVDVMEPVEEKRR